MRFLKLIFSRATIITLCIFLQVFLFAMLIWNFRSYFWFFISLIILLEVFVFIRINNREINPSQQILWITLVIGVPLIGICLYMLLGTSKYGPQKKKKFKEAAVRYKSFSAEKNLRLTNYAEQSNYIFNSLHFPAFSNTKTDYIKSGKEFLNKLIIDLNKAERYIFLEFYIIEKGKMWDLIFEILIKKVQEGLDVKLIYDDFGTITRLPSNFDKMLRKNGIDAIKFNRYNPFVTLAHNNRDHRKIVVIDGKIAYTGGINISDDYVEPNEKRVWKDSAQRLSGQAVNSFVLMFLQVYETTSTQKIDVKNYLATHNTSDFDGYVQPFATGPLPFYKETYALNIFLNLINQAKKSIYISTPYLIPDFQIMNALIIAKVRGVKIKIVIPDIPDKKIPYLMTKSNCVKLIKNGADVYKLKNTFVHSKSMLVDDEIGIIGTINFDYRSFIHNFECGIWQYETSALKELKAEYENIFKNVLSASVTDFKMNWFKKTLANIIKVLSPIF